MQNYFIVVVLVTLSLLAILVVGAAPRAGVVSDLFFLSLAVAATALIGMQESRNL
jgi:hypothetical protein